MDLFQCGISGGMRRSRKTNSLVVVSDHTRGVYKDRWEGDVLHYTGMGLKGDQNIDHSQNRTLNESRSNGVEVHLFEVFTPTQYVYRGRVELVADADPYREVQPMKLVKIAMCGSSRSRSLPKGYPDRCLRSCQRYF